MSDAAKAREVYSRMSASNREDPSTQYLLYKVALSFRDIELGINTLSYHRTREAYCSKATECLDAICIACPKDATLLYACVLEAQQTGDQVQMVVSLQRVLAKYEYSAPSGVHLPALLRYDSIPLKSEWTLMVQAVLLACLCARLTTLKLISRIASTISASSLKEVNLGFLMPCVTCLPVVSCCTGKTVKARSSE